MSENVVMSFGRHVASEAGLMQCFVARFAVLGAKPNCSLAATLVPFEAQSLLSHALYFFSKLSIFFVEPRVFRFQRIALAQFLKRFLDGEFVDFSHFKSSSSRGVRLPLHDLEASSFQLPNYRFG